MASYGLTKTKQHREVCQNTVHSRASRARRGRIAGAAETDLAHVALDHDASQLDRLQDVPILVMVGQKLEKKS